MELTEKQKNRIEKISQKCSLALLLLFGSQVTGQTHKESDFDIAYIAEKQLNLKQESQFIVDLNGIFKTEKVDLTNLKNASPLLVFGIFQNCQILYQNQKDPLLFARLRVYSFKRYIETKPFYELKFQRLRKKLVKVAG
ncbi:MAG: nucleotidyltransferase domain-containing protein [Candidatus Pacebacteria bacterium]|nr:nucleotidyltransferase domain-containing protein [Candidatus Paceibacterota bacterium]